MPSRAARKAAKKVARKQARKVMKKKRRVFAFLKSTEISNAIQAEQKDLFGDADMSDDSGSVTDTEAAYARESSALSGGFLALDPSAALGRAIHQELKDTFGVVKTCVDTGSVPAIRKELKDKFGVVKCSDTGSFADAKSAHSRESSAPPGNFLGPGPLLPLLCLWSCLDPC